MIQRRAFLTGLVAAFAAPAIVRADSLMRVRGVVMPPPIERYVFRTSIPAPTWRLLNEGVPFARPGLAMFYATSKEQAEAMFREWQATP